MCPLVAWQTLALIYRNPLWVTLTPRGGLLNLATLLWSPCQDRDADLGNKKLGGFVV